MSIGIPGRRTAWITLLLLTILAVSVVLVPAWIIQPFRPQSQTGVALAFAMRRWSPLLTVIALVLALVLVMFLWRGTRSWWRKVALVLIVLPLPAATWLARQNHFEWMFRPLPNAAYARASEVVFLGNSDMVIAIESNGDAAAYPVRLMAYHHLVQDRVGGTPIVATY